MRRLQFVVMCGLLSGFAGLASAQVDCGRVEQVKIKAKPRRGKVKVVVKSDMPGGTMLTLEQDLGDVEVESVQMVLNAGGKGRIFFRNVVMGGTAVRIVECDGFSNCYAACAKDEGDFSTCFKSCDDGRTAMCGCREDGESRCECVE